MYWKHKVQIYFFCVMLSAHAVFAKTFMESVRDLMTFNVPEDIFESVNRSIVGKLRAKDIKFTLPNKIEMDDVEVLDENGQRVLYGKHVKLVLSLMSLLTNNIRITDAFVDSPHFHYTIYKEVHNVIRVFEERSTVATEGESSSETTRVTIERVHVENGSYEMHHDAGVDIYAHGVKAEGTFWVEPGPFGVDISKVTIAGGMIKTGGMDLPLTNVVANGLWISDEKVSAKELTALYEKAPLKGSGTVFIAEERYDIDAVIDAPAGTYPAGLSPLPFPAPAFSARVKMLGILTDPEIGADVKLGPTEFRKLKINGGTAKASISAHRVAINSAVLDVGTGGGITANGVVDIDAGKYHFSSTEKNILAEELSQFLSFEANTTGIVNASATFDGSLDTNDQTMRITATGAILDGKVDRISLTNKTNFSVAVDLALEKSVKIKSAKFSDDRGLSISVSGRGDFVKESVALDYDMAIPKLSTYLKLPTPNDDVENLKTKGQLAYDELGLMFAGPFSAASARYAKFSASNINGRVDFEKDQLTLSKVTAAFYQGSLSANLSISNFSQSKSLTGVAVVRNAALEPLANPFSPIRLAGKLSSSFTIGGTLTNPEVSFLAEVEDLNVDRARFVSLQLSGQIAKKRLDIFKLDALMETGSIDARDLSYDNVSGKISGSATVTNLNIASTLAKYGAKLDGDISGVINIDGTLASPELHAPFVVSNLKAYGLNLGGGSATLSLARRPLLTGVGAEDLVFSIAANLAWRGSTSATRFSVALNQKTINADILFEELEVNTDESKLFDGSVGVIGRVSGSIIAEGYLRSPVLTVSIFAKEYGFFDRTIRDGAKNIKKMHGPATLHARSKNGKLDLALCASFLAATGGRYCQDEQALTLALSGPFNLDEFSLNGYGRIDHNRFEEILLPLKKELATLDGAASFSSTFAKSKNGPLTFSITADVERMQASMPNIPAITLTKPVAVTVTNDGLEIAGNAVFDFSPGQLTVGGSFSRSSLDIHLDGSIPLVINRLFIPLVQSAEGLAEGSLSLTGSFDSPILAGRIVPEPSSHITLRRWLEPIEVRSGAISFTPTSTRSFLTKFDNIKLAVGDGRLFVNGDLHKQYETKDQQSGVKLDVELQGSNIVLRDRLNFVEVDFNVVTKQEKDEAPLAVGEIIVTDGVAHRQFDLRNFVLSAQQGASGFSALPAIDMKLDLDIAVRQFKASARMLNLDIETILRAQMTLEGPIAHPKFKGALFVTEGAITFPSTSFDLVETPIVLDENSSRMFDPKIDIVATQDLEKVDFPQINQDTTIELSLSGNLDRLDLGLRSVRGDLRLSQLKIFLLLLSPRGIAGFDDDDQFERLKRGAQNAAMAFSGEVFLRPLTNELQELLEGKTKTRIQFGSALEPGGVSLRLNWKLGPRMELQGSYMFLMEDARSAGREKSTFFMDDQNLLGDLKLKLLLFDHRPAGPLFIEASFGSARALGGIYEPRGKVRLKYRVISR